ncbi:hypothetical protein OKA04_22450 [Luteolibacter flavescens]|uniref:Alpha-glutamyl/putrescinyl thymine pyrophosphorylase clade 3 domain-containing protein n=1 Tax=Luteolibacter flavescens TaxID=1859460 RepID=A0ABT3FVA1_9BACT|nr:hypothetical protein [Luteolibacter flavescens]MCW1887514.1 hypothetical protein [Luteolibacter flavescens]
MKPKDATLAGALLNSLDEFEKSHHSLPGISSKVARWAWVEQLVESVRRDRYIAQLVGNQQKPIVADPNSIAFDPIKAGIYYNQQGVFEEACWLIFLSVHFGKNRRTGWRLVRDVYGRLGQGNWWTWDRITNYSEDFIQWLSANMNILKGADGVPRYFGNHRKYQSLSATSQTGTGASIHSYIEWVQNDGTHRELIDRYIEKNDGDPRKVFSALYKAMTVSSFGRMAKFDYLAQMGRTQLFPIEPNSPYFEGATGPLKAAKLLLAGNSEAKISWKEAEDKIIALESYLEVGMQAMEDSLCNWQKSPMKFKPFRG